VLDGRSGKLKPYLVMYMEGGEGCRKTVLIDLLFDKRISQMCPWGKIY
jgi:hypothetical protein